MRISTMGVFFFFFLSFFSAHASTSVGTIIAGSQLTKVCHDTTCTTFGTVNWKPTIVGTALPVTITDSSITGHIWGDQIGWINLAPTGTGVMVNSTTGVLSGKAFASSGSWINFSPTGSGVTLVDNGAGSNFSGFAWVSGIYGGWMKFDCGGTGTCIKTDWRTITNRGSSGGGGIVPFFSFTPTPTPTPTTVIEPTPTPAVTTTTPTTSPTTPTIPTPTTPPATPTKQTPTIPQPISTPTPPLTPTPGTEPTITPITEPTLIDVCFNIEGIQNSVPAGYVQNENSECIFLQNQFDQDKDGEPDVPPTVIQKEPVAESFKNFFSSAHQYNDKKPCTLCLLVRKEIVFDKRRGQDVEKKIIKWGFVPKALEIKNTDFKDYSSNYTRYSPSTYRSRSNLCRVDYSCGLGFETPDCFSPNPFIKWHRV